MRNTSRAEAGLFAHAVLGFWLGIYAFRAYVPATVWNLSDTLPLYSKGALAIGVTALGVIAAFTPLVRGARSMNVLATIVALIGSTRQLFIGNDVLGSVLSLAGWMVWLWWFAAFIRSVPAASIGTIICASPLLSRGKPACRRHGTVSTCRS